MTSKPSRRDGIADINARYLDHCHERSRVITAVLSEALQRAEEQVKVLKGLDLGVAEERFEFHQTHIELSDEAVRLVGKIETALDEMQNNVDHMMEEYQGEEPGTRARGSAANLEAEAEARGASARSQQSNGAVRHSPVAPTCDGHGSQAQRASFV